VESRDVGNKKHTTIVKGLLSFTPIHVLTRSVKFTKKIKGKKEKVIEDQFTKTIKGKKEKL